MIKFSDLKILGTRAVGRGILMSKNYSPEILTAVGVVGVVGAAVLASRATLRLEPVIEKFSNGIELTNDRETDIEIYTESDQRKDLAYVYMHGAIDIGKLYAPAFLLGVGSISCIVGANGIMRRRNIALMAAYKAIETSFSEYRKRVVEEYGEEKDLEYRRGLRTVKQEVVGKNGKKTTKEVTIVDPNGISQYARFFDPLSPSWDRNGEYNLIFLRAQQHWANDRLQARGHILLNEVYDDLGVPRSKAGAVVGWALDKEGDNYVDFGIYDFQNEKAREFVNGYESAILLDFNVNGVILDLIEEEHR